MPNDELDQLDDLAKEAEGEQTADGAAPIEGEVLPPETDDDFTAENDDIVELFSMIIEGLADIATSRAGVKKVTTAEADKVSKPAVKLINMYGKGSIPPKAMAWIAIAAGATAIALPRVDEYRQNLIAARELAEAGD